MSACTIAGFTSDEQRLILMAKRIARMSQKHPGYRAALKHLDIELSKALAGTIDFFHPLKKYS